MCCGQKRMDLKNSSSSSNQTSQAPRPVQPRNQVSPQVRQQTASTQHLPGQRMATMMTPPATRPVPLPGAVAADSGEVPVQYLANSPIVVRGQMSGKMYRFSGATPIQQVERRDAAAFLQSRFFRNA